MQNGIALVVSLVLISSAAKLIAQAPPIAERPTITVAAFEYGSAASHFHDDPGRRRMERHGVHDGAGLVAALGTGATALIVEKLVESQRFRVYERAEVDGVRRERALESNSDDALPRARYILAGSVSRLGMNDKSVGGAGAGRALGRLAALAVRTSSTTVHLTARVVDTRTGEIIGSFTGVGESKKRWGVTAIGMAPGGIGGGRVVDSNFRETAIGEATTRAASAIVEQVIALRATRLRP
jgi:curli biogenesis system outer membrane secretion channel CsgG